jgi:hypothetical protein
MSQTAAFAAINPTTVPDVAASTTLAPMPTTISRRTGRIGLVVSGIPTLLLALDASLKLLRLTPAIEGTVQLGYPASVVLPLDLIQLACLILYAVPRTAVLGAILWTGYLGGAVATHVRVGNPVLTHMLVPVAIGGLLWFGLWLRDANVRAAVGLAAPRS